MSKLDELNMQVTAKIVQIENAQRELSLIEEEIAKLTLPNSVEGHVARKGAIRAAIEGRSEQRAKELFDLFNQEDIDESLREELLKAFLTIYS